MDELTQWQIEEAARQGRELQKWLENDSGMINAVLRISEQHQALIKMLTNSGFIAEMERTTALIRAFQNSAVGVVLQVQTTYAEMVAVLTGLHWHYEGVGTTFTVTLDDDDSAKGAIQERHLTLPANDTLILSDEATANVIKNVLAQPQAITPPSIQSETAFGVAYVEGRASLAGTATLNAMGTVINASSIWSVERSANSEGQHGFIFRGIGGEEMRRKVDLLADVAQWVMSDDKSAFERLLTSFRFTNGISAAESQLRTPTADATPEAVHPTAGGTTESMSKYDRNYMPPDLPEELHELWRAHWFRREAGRLGRAWNEAVKSTEADGDTTPQKGTPKKNSDHWAYPSPEKRAEIVKHYRCERDNGNVSNKHAWAQNNYQITGRALKRYEDEYDLKTDM